MSLVRAPLSLAAGNGHEGVVKLLLGREDVDPNRQDRWGRTALSLAADKGYGGVVKLLLGRESVDPNRPDNSNQTPLSWAVQRGHKEVVKMLQVRNSATPPHLRTCSGRHGLSQPLEPYSVPLRNRIIHIIIIH
ncbi:ankyrin, partial [Choiromyces venosus 120613-1]